MTTQITIFHARQKLSDDPERNRDFRFELCMASFRAKQIIRNLFRYTHEPVAVLNCGDLEAAWCWTQNIDEIGWLANITKGYVKVTGEAITKESGARSSMMGDVFLLNKEGKLSYHMVAACGFEEVEVQMP